jgi:aminopeptidase N
MKVPGLLRPSNFRGVCYRLIGLFCGLMFLSEQAAGQVEGIGREDSLRGSITKEREWWDLLFYHLSIKVEPDRKAISGSNLIRYRVDAPYQKIQIDLQEPLRITKVLQEGVEQTFTRDGSVWMITLTKTQTPGSIRELTVFYAGVPKEAIRPPWEGGVQWTRDKKGNWFVATSCQGLGASVWWPCKDHMYDEPDSMRISVNVPEGLKNVSNGRLYSEEKLDDGSVTYHWGVKNPINNYGVNFNIGNYVNWHETYLGENGALDVSYYVLPENLEVAKKHFIQVPMTLKAFEHWFGPYPFYSDGFKIVEVPYLGMEHQSSVTYGNQYANGYLGRDLSGTGWGMKFDFILIHETGHEWFANNITYRDIADMWIHESFTSYGESLYLEYHFGKKAASEYLIGTRATIQNQAKVMGVFGVNRRGSGDMYPKGANMLHTLRQIVDDDELWRKLLRGLNKEFYHKTVTGADIVEYLNKSSGKNLSLVFKQYLEDIRIPVLEYTFKDKALHYRWNKVIQGFDMPVKVSLGNVETWLYPVADTWAKLETPQTTLEVSPDFYVTSLEFRD